MTAIYKYTWEGSRNGEEELFKSKVTGQISHGHRTDV